MHNINIKITFLAIRDYIFPFEILTVQLKMPYCATKFPHALGWPALLYGQAKLVGLMVMRPFCAVRLGYGCLQIYCSKKCFDSKMF